ncbi:DUF3466 family protein [Vibrio brasiliensis]|jgi:hypothetical protein|uniref:DUF3466 family protein n=1 Tax=Vibrio brasiliensis TaxID=170652 RepID=UPI001EFE85E5|nr:DUF3466 family protein [Vibrio brasiliensis]MCG9749053.1 DUF3466 family protein [Vibrio brasiliensis]MCG9783900.1 DUF3466 family protein [Vibrio brasiliensis]
MSSNIFKVSLVAATVAASFGANAALYNVYLEAPEGTSSSLQTYGVAIAPNATVCWSNACSESTSVMATEVKRYREGYQYRDESPFFLPFGWTYLDDNYDGFRSYCRNFLGYTDSLCEKWADKQYTQGYANEKGGNYAGSIAYVDGSVVKSGLNTVVNTLIDDSGIKAVGSAQDSAITSYRSMKGFVDGTDFNDGGDTEIVAAQYWTKKTLTAGTFITGSVSRDNISVGNKDIITSKPTVWKDADPADEITWAGGNTENGDSKAQGSVRDIIEDSGDTTKLYAVGYTSDSDVRLKAAVFKSTDSGDSWSTGTLVGGFPYDSSEYANQTLKAVNDNKIAIGTAKLNRSQNGAYANTLFYVNNLDSPTYKAFSGSIFFTGANGKAGNINNHNDVVGTIDFETHKETGGSPRAKRAFIANLGTTSDSAPIGGVARYLDDLTYGSGASTNNNQYRIIEAADINDAGIIAATALYCSGGFDSEAIDADCSSGGSYVGVKLVPINGQTANDISARPVAQETIERQGGTIGFITLTLLGLLGFRKK